MEPKISEINRGLAPGSRGTTPAPLEMPPMTIVIHGKPIPKKGKNRKVPRRRVANELSRLFCEMAKFVKSDRLPKVKTSKDFLEADIKIDESFRWIKNPGRELSIRFFKHVLYQWGKIELTRNNLIQIYEFSNWRVKTGGETEGARDADVRQKLVARLDANEKTIKYSVSEDDVQALQRSYRKWREIQIKLMLKAAKEAQKFREESARFVGDFYRAHVNGLVGVVEGFMEIPMLVPNLVGVARGKDWTHARLPKIDYVTPWGKRNGTAMEAGVGIGLTGPMMAVTRSVAVVNALGDAGTALNLSPRIVAAVKVLVIGSEVAEGIQTAYEVHDAVQILRTGKITEGGVTRDATDEELDAALESLLFQAAGRITSTSMARSAHSAAGHLDNRSGSRADQNSDRAHSPEAKKASDAKQIEKEIIAALEGPVNRDRPGSAAQANKPQISSPLPPTVKSLDAKLATLKSKQKIAWDRRVELKATGKENKNHTPIQKEARAKHRALKSEADALIKQRRIQRKREKQEEKERENNRPGEKKPPKGYDQDWLSHERATHGYLVKKHPNGIVSKQDDRIEIAAYVRNKNHLGPGHSENPKKYVLGPKCTPDYLVRPDKSNKNAPVSVEDAKLSKGAPLTPGQILVNEQLRRNGENGDMGGEIVSSNNPDFSVGMKVSAQEFSIVLPEHILKSKKEGTSSASENKGTDNKMTDNKGTGE